MPRRCMPDYMILVEMSEAWVDVSVLSCLLGWNASLDECRLINDDLARVQAQYRGKFVGLIQAPVLEGKQALQEIERAIQPTETMGSQAAWRHWPPRIQSCCRAWTRPSASPFLRPRR
jgi:predicted TIM-barrel fold metal-dependent hydrolase